MVKWWSPRPVNLHASIAFRSHSTECLKKNKNVIQS